MITMGKTGAGAANPVICVPTSKTNVSNRPQQGISMEAAGCMGAYNAPCTISYTADGSVSL